MKKEAIDKPPEKWEILTKISYWRSELKQSDSISDRKILRQLIRDADKRIKEGRFSPDTLTVCEVGAQQSQSDCLTQDALFIECFNKVFKK